MKIRIFVPFHKFGAKIRKAAFCALPVLTGLAGWTDVVKADVATNAANPLASAKTGEAALMGILYDLKQTEEGRPAIGDTRSYDRTIADFVMKNWDESILNKFYRIPEPFFTTQIFIPMLGNKIAPKAFGIENRIKDGYWVIHYKGQVVPPSDGRYRFAGYAHATMLVAINGRLALNGCRFDITTVQKDFPLRSVQSRTGDPQAGAPAGDFGLTLGPWMDLKHEHPVDIDILFGNRQAAELCAFLLVQKEGETYPTDPVTHYPILPLFQVARYYGVLPQDKFSTRCLTNAMIWNCLQ